MAATKNNQWWKLRAKHGRDKIFESPEMLWDSCSEYFEATDNRKWNKIEYKNSGKGIRKVSIPTDTPFTLNGLCLFLGIGTSTWHDYKTKEEYKDFSEVITRVEQIVYIQKFEGASVNAFNANIISRELGLVDRADHTTKGESLNYRPIFGELDSVFEDDKANDSD
jgi:hypothetical protein